MYSIFTLVGDNFMLRYFEYYGNTLMAVCLLLLILSFLAGNLHTFKIKYAGVDEI
jgi:hypothetical protein